MKSKMSDTGIHELDMDSARILTERALKACGASPQVASSVARSCLIPQAEGLHAVGLSHLIEYCQALKEGRVDGQAEHKFLQPTPVIFQADASGGFPHPAFDTHYDAFIAATKEFGVTVMAISNGFTCGALGYFVGRLAEQGLVAIAATNASAMLAASGTTQAVFGTNPLAFAVPRANHPPLLIDQSSSHSAYVNIQAAALAGDPIPAGWALDSKGHPTTDPQTALEGVLLAFGGQRGANIALMVELLAAGVTGSNWSLDAPQFNAGPACPGVGLFISAINPQLLDSNFEQRCDVYLERIESRLGAYIPGARRAAERERSEAQGLRISAEVIQILEQYAEQSI